MGTCSTVRGERRLWMLLSAIALALGVLAAPAAASVAEPTPLGHACKAENGVRFCPTETLAQRARHG